VAVINKSAPELGNQVARARGLVSGAIWSVIVAAALMFLAENSLLPEAPDKVTYDWRTAILSDRAKEQRSDIAIVLINDDSLSKYWWLSPVDRALIAEIVRAVDSAGPKAIGLDFIFDRPAEEAKNRALVQAIRQARSPVIVGAIDRRAWRVKPRDLKRQEDFIARLGRPAGHLFFKHKEDRFSLSDDVVRFLSEPSPDKTKRKSLAQLLAEVSGRRFTPKSSYIDWQLPPEAQGAELFATLRVPEHEPVDGSGIGESVLPVAQRDLMRGKIVLIGGDFIDRDRHRTPLSILDGADYPGVWVHAQILAQLLDKRSVVEVPRPAEFATLFLLGWFGFCLGYRFRLKRYDVFVSFAGVIVLIALGGAAFWFAKLIIPSTTLFMAWIVGVTSGHFYHWTRRRLGLPA